jgi:hypothetical protein
MRFSFRKKFQLLILLALPLTAGAQLKFWEPADTFHHGRFWTVSGFGAGVYAGFSVGLWQAWYKDYDLGPFHTFNDLGEWQQMDKVGHVFSAYIQSYYCMRGARWTGMRHPSSTWTGFAVGNLLMMTIETMDGFSTKWGFSFGDIAANLTGSGLMVAQEYLWGEQRIRAKVSSDIFSEYPQYSLRAINAYETTTLAARAENLFGSSFGEKFLKDYNRQIDWASVNLWSFFPEREISRFPRWLNVAVGYSAENMYGGFRNEWKTDNGVKYVLPDNIYPRYRQVFLSLDVDLSRIRTRSRFLHTLLDAVNWLKIPAPALEITTQGQVRFHPIWW